jgi:ATPase subunit of ABC transporter with duplicated ATPase domains
LDEPSNELDAAGRARLAEILNQVSMTLVVVSHETTFLEKVVSQCIRLENGRLV